MRLYIIGNGFDLNHGLQTSYWNYKNFLLQQYPTLAMNYEYSEFLSATECSIDTRWNDVEGGLALRYEDAFEDMVSNYYPDLNSEHTPGWDDINVETENQFAFLREFTGNAFHEWLISIENNLGTIKPVYLFMNKDVFINFNYTTTLERIYGILPANVLHIHGVVGNPDSIQFGNPENIPSEIEDELKSTYSGDEFFDVTISPAITSMENYAHNAYKDIYSNIGNLTTFLQGHGAISDVCVMGHTLLGIDDAYYNQVMVPLSQGAIWTIYVHNDEDVMRANGFVTNYQIKQFQLVQW